MIPHLNFAPPSCIFTTTPPGKNPSNWFPPYEENRKPRSKVPLTRFFFPTSNTSCWLELEFLTVPSCSVRFISSCYTITCLWREVGRMHMILLTYETYIMLPCFWSYRLDSPVCLVNGLSVDANHCITSICHHDVAGAFQKHPSRISRPRDVNLIDPLHTKCGIA